MQRSPSFRKDTAIGLLLVSGLLASCGAKRTNPNDDPASAPSTNETASGGANSGGMTKSETGGAPGVVFSAGSGGEAGAGMGSRAPDGTAPSAGGMAAEADSGANGTAQGDLEADSGTGAAETVGGDVQASADAEASEPAHADAGASTQQGGTSQMEVEAGVANEPCKDESLRCNPQTKVRELCQGGTWLEQDFVCATSVRVNPHDGIACAVKADERFTCWWGRSKLQLQDVAVPELPSPLHSVDYAVYSPEGAEANAAFFTRDGTLVDFRGEHIENVVQFESNRYDLCWVTRDGSGICSEFGPVSTSPAKQVAMDMNRRCVLLLDGSVTCRADQASPVTLPGYYTAIHMASYKVCGLDLAGKVWCTDLTDEALAPMSPLDGTYTKLAASDVGVCALLGSGELECAVDGGEAYQPPGTYTELDAGDWTVCAIHTDGSVACWQADALGELEMWLTPEGW